MLSGYKIMWLFVLFDLPTLTKEHRKLHTRFRKNLEKMGFSRAQFSVYINHYASEDATLSIQKRVQNMLPPEGNVRLLLVTDRQFGKMLVLNSRKKIQVEQPLPQVLLF
jgi:CRISPR-associated protein Cas2